MRIVITGSPGTGKSSIAKALAKTLKLELIELNSVAKKIGKKKGREIEVSIKKLEKEVKNKLKGKKSYVVEGHLACEFSIKCDLLIILRCNPMVLMTRLNKRRYPKSKVIDNVLAEAQDYFVFKAEENYSHFIQIDTSKKVSIKKVLNSINRRKTVKVNWFKELRFFASQGF